MKFHTFFFYAAEHFSKSTSFGPIGRVFNECLIAFAFFC